jgi:arylsulfatase A-like enzyme
MTSQPVELHGVATRGASLSEIDVDLASRLGDAGYRTVGVSGNSHIRAQAGFARGFGAWTSLASEIDGASPHPLSDRGDPVARRAPTAAEINREVLERLPRSEPLFLFVHYMDPHSDYAPPERHRRRFETDPSAHAEGRAAHTDTLVDLLRGRATADERERQRLIDLYDAEIASVDEAIGELLASLQERGFGDDLFVALVSDHGESFGEHDAWLHGVNLHSEVLRIPMIFWDSQRPRPEIVREDPASLIDVATTLLARAGIEAVRRMRGRDLLAAGPRAPRELSAVLEHEALLEERLGPRPQRRSLLLWPWKAMVTASGETWAYHLEDDPRELEPVVLSDPRIPARLRGVVAEARAEVLAANRAQRLQSAGAGSSPSPEDRAQARALEDAQ